MVVTRTSGVYAEYINGVQQTLNPTTLSPVTDFRSTASGSYSPSFDVAAYPAPDVSTLFKVIGFNGTAINTGSSQLSLIGQFSFYNYALSGGANGQVAAHFAAAEQAVPIPEPSTLALLITGLSGLLAYAWRKRR